MPSHAPLLAAIAAAPDDDLPRLVFADWLDEHGDPDRAEFIRLQVHTARVGPLDPTWAPAKLREFELFKANETKWRTPTASREGRMLMDRWRRGFPASIMLDDVAEGRLTSGEWANGVYDWHASPEERYDPWPGGPVREVTFGGWDNDCGDLLWHPQLRTVRSLSLQEWYAGVGSRRPETFASDLSLLPPGHFPELTTLSFGDGELTLTAVETLADSAVVGQLKGLRLRFPSDTPYTEYRGWEVAVSRLFHAVAPHLEALAVEQLSPILAAEFARPRWPELRRLTISQRGAVGLDAFASADLPKLSALLFDLQSYTPGRLWTTTPIDAVARWPALRSVRSLSLGGMTDLMLRRFLAATDGAGFRFLGAHVLRHDTHPFRLGEWGEYPCLRELSALAGAFSYGDLAALTDSHVLPQVHTVWNNEPVPFPHPLPWSGGTRALIPRDTTTSRRPPRNHWCGWFAELFGGAP